MRSARACCALVALVVAASPGVAHADSTSNDSERCTAYPDECRPKPAAPTPEVIWVRETAPDPLRAAHGWQVGLRIGVAHPGGSVGGGSPATTPHVSDLAQGWVPFGVDVGYRLAPWAYLGVSGLWGGAFGDDSSLCVACGFRYDAQVLAELRVYAWPHAVVSPWLSYGAGWEVMHVHFDSDGPTGTATYQGPVLASFQVGLDVRRRAVAVGPYFGVELAEFVLHALDPSPAGETSSVAATSLHEWFTLGVRGSYGP